MFKFNKNRKKGFSLVELIVVIAILAVIAIVLIPALLSYVEESRAGKDTKTTDELVSSVELALSEQDVYDELLEHAIEDNVSCYVDKLNESECTNKIVIKAATDSISEWYEFGDDDRKADETPYFAGGNMRGVTITFSPVKSSNESEYVLKDGIINKFVGRNTGYVHENGKIYNAIRSVMGDVMHNSSQTYRNSDFTIFIRMGTTGGNEASQQDAVKVYGQFNGTNLTANDTNLYKLTADRQTGTDGLVDFALNEKNNASKGQPDFSETAFMGTGVTTSTGTGNVIQKAPEDLTNTAIAFYCEEDASLNFTRINEAVNVGDIINGKTATAIYYNIETDIYPNGGSVPWATYREQIKSVKTIDWVQPIYTQYWFATFKNCNNFDLSKMDTSKTVSMMGMFGFAGYNCKDFTLNLAGFATTNLKDATMMFYDAGYNAENFYVNLFDMTKENQVESLQCLFYEAGYNAKKWKTSDVTHWNVSKCKDLGWLFFYAGYNADTWRVGDVSNWDVSQVTNMKSMFNSCGYKTNAWNIGDLSQWDVGNVENMSWMFSNAGYSSQKWNIGDISNWNTSKVNTMQAMFSNAGRKSESFYIGDLKNWNVENVTVMYSFIQYCPIEKLDTSNWKFSNVTNLGQMFWGCNKLTTIGNISGWNPSNVVCLDGTFNSTSIEYLDVSGWNVSKCITFCQMFENSSKLKQINGLESWNTSSCVSFTEMFKGCTSLETLNLSSFNTKKAYDAWQDPYHSNATHDSMAIMFSGMNSLKQITFGENFSFNGSGDCKTPVILPTPNPEYISGADGKWYSVTTGTSYEPNKLPDDTADTYVAVNPN